MFTSKPRQSDLLIGTENMEGPTQKGGMKRGSQNILSVYWWIPVNLLKHRTGKLRVNAYVKKALNRQRCLLCGHQDACFSSWARLLTSGCVFLKHLWKNVAGLVPGYPSKNNLSTYSSAWHNAQMVKQQLPRKLLFWKWPECAHSEERQFGSYCLGLFGAGGLNSTSF